MDILPSCPLISLGLVLPMGRLPIWPLPRSPKSFQPQARSLKAEDILADSRLDSAWLNLFRGGQLLVEEIDWNS